jgi:two-component system LytT family response regulator
MSYSIVIIDDERHCTESLELLIQSVHPDLQIAGRFNDSREALEYLSTHSVDLVFLDIEMPGMGGFELLSRLGETPFDVIFVTAYDQYAIKAFNYSAISYLLKPVDEEELDNAISRWKEKNQKVLTMAQLALMNDMLKSNFKLKSRIALPTLDGLEFIEIADILRCESESNYTRIYCRGEIKYLICRTLKEVEQVLTENGFIRVHHSHLINPQFIKKFVRNDGAYLLMTDGASIPISRSKKNRLFDLFINVERL